MNLRRIRTIAEVAVSLAAFGLFVCLGRVWISGCDATPTKY